jgi:fatty-acyl-CoA synthase
VAASWTPCWHPGWGEAGCPCGCGIPAFVELRKGENASEEDILAFAREHLSGYVRPASVEIVGELPNTSTGKIQKASLRAKEWEGRGRRIG